MSKCFFIEEYTALADSQPACNFRGWVAEVVAGYQGDLLTSIARSSLLRRSKKRQTYSRLISEAVEYTGIILRCPIILRCCAIFGGFAEEL